MSTREEIGSKFKTYPLVTEKQYYGMASSSGRGNSWLSPASTPLRSVPYRPAATAFTHSRLRNLEKE